MATAVSSPDAPRAIGPYSQALLADGPAGRTLFCSGQIALDPATGELVQGSAAAQAERAMDNLGAVLAAAGMSFADVVKTTVFLADLGDFAAVNEVYGRRFQGTFPARSTVQVAALPRGARVEIEAVAVRGTRRAAGRARPRRRSSRRARRR